MAALWEIHRSGDLSPERLAAIVSGHEKPNTTVLGLIIYSLWRRDKDLCLKFCSSLYKKGCEPDVLRPMFSLLASTRSPEVDALFAEFLQNDDGWHPSLTETVHRYFKDGA